MSLEPGSEAELADAVRAARGGGRSLRIRGGGTRDGLGHAVDADEILDVGGLSGITLYEPGALTLVVGAGTPLAEVVDALAAENQMLPFEPMGFGAIAGAMPRGSDGRRGRGRRARRGLDDRRRRRDQRLGPRAASRPGPAATR